MSATFNPNFSYSSSKCLIVRTVINNFTFDGSQTDPIQKSIRDALLAFMSTIGQAQAEATKHAQQAGIAHARPVRPAEVKDLLFRLGRVNDTTGLNVERAQQLLDRVRAAHKCRALPLGAVIGEPKRADEIFGRRPGTTDLDYNWAWPLTDIEKFDVPIPTRGMQGFWNWRPPATQCQNVLTRHAADLREQEIVH